MKEGITKQGMATNTLSSLTSSVNQRTLFGLIILGALLGLVLIMRLHETAVETANARDMAAARLATHGGHVDLDTWTERAARADEALNAWRGTQWAGATPGLVAAELQREISRMTASAEITVRALQVDPETTELNGRAFLRFRLTGQSPRGESVARLLASLSQHQPQIIITEMNSTFTSDTSGRFSAEGYAPINLLTNGNETPSRGAQ